jgi:hypothetical protein
MFNNSVLTCEKIHHIPITKIGRLMFREGTAIYCENKMKHTSAELLNHKAPSLNFFLFSYSDEDECTGSPIRKNVI